MQLNLTIENSKKKGLESPILKTDIPHHILLVYPNIKINTKDAFNQLKNYLLNENMDINLSNLLKELKNNNFDSKLFKNDFEMYVFETHPEIGPIKLKLKDFGAEYASLSGTGSTVFGIFSSKNTTTRRYICN